MRYDLGCNRIESWPTFAVEINENEKYTLLITNH